MKYIGEMYCHSFYYNAVWYVIFLNLWTSTILSFCCDIYCQTANLLIFTYDMHIDTTIKRRNVMGNLSIYLIAKGNIRLRNMNAYSANRKILVNVILWIGLCLQVIESTNIYLIKLTTMVFCLPQFDLSILLINVR